MSAVAGLLAMSAAVTVYLATMSVWLSAHPQADNSMWGDRASSLLGAVAVLVLADVCILVYVMCCIAKRREEAAKGLWAQCTYPLLAGGERCPECGGQRECEERPASD